VEKIFQKYGTTAAAHGAYAAQHMEEINGLLSTYPAWEARYARLRARQNAVSTSIYGVIQSRVLGVMPAVGGAFAR
jgi:hypothetical protein